jgi:hypothetical protein
MVGRAEPVVQRQAFFQLATGLTVIAGARELDRVVEQALGFSRRIAFRAGYRQAGRKRAKEKTTTGDGSAHD